MKTKETLCREMFERIDIFGEEHKTELQLSPRAIELFAENKANLLAIRNATGNQVSGTNTKRNGTEQRAQLGQSLRRTLRIMSEIARTLDPVQFPGIGDQFPAPQPAHQRYGRLIALAIAFAQDAEPMQQTFIDRGMPGDFLAQLRQTIVKFEAVTGLKQAAIQTSAASVADVSNSIRHGMRLARELRAALRFELNNKPGLNAAWKRAARVESTRSRQPSAASSTAQPAAASAAANPSAASAALPAPGLNAAPLAATA